MPFRQCHLEGGLYCAMLHADVRDSDDVTLHHRPYSSGCFEFDVHFPSTYSLPSPTPRGVKIARKDCWWRVQPSQQCFPSRVGNRLRTFTMHALCVSHAAFNKYCNQREQHGPLQPKPLRRRQRLPPHSKHAVWPCGRDVVAAVHAVAGAGFDPIVNHGTRDSSAPHFHPRRYFVLVNSKTLKWGNQVGSKLSLRMHADVRCIDAVLAHSF